jgi:hypothetical protein
MPIGMVFEAGWSEGGLAIWPIAARATAEDAASDEASWSKPALARPEPEPPVRGPGPKTWPDDWLGPTPK